jgi:hypothetical protein
MSDATLRTGLIRLAHSNPNLRPALLPLIRTAEEHGPGSVWKTESGNWRAKNEKGEAKSFGDDQDAAKTHAGKGGAKSKGKGPKTDSVYSKKHGVYLRGISDEALDAFYASPAGKEIKNYNLEVIAGKDGVVDAKSIERAVKVRDKYLAVERAKKKPKSERTKADDDALDVCQSTPACEGNLGVARSSMPQFLQMSPKAAIAGMADKRYKELLDGEKSGKGLPDDIDNDEREAYYNRKNAEAAVAAGADPNSDVSVFDDWVKNLRKGGVKVTKPKGGMRVGDLKATQSEISADAVLRNADKYLSGKELMGGVIYVSSDGHILDGHHRWAGLLTADPDAKIPVVQIGVPMAELLEKSFQHPGVFRQNFRFEIVPEDEPLDLARQLGSTWQQKGGKWYGKNSEGKAGGPFASQDAAKDYAAGKSGKSAAHTLRGRLIRLAHARPDLRSHLLPLVTDRVAGRGVSIDDLPGAEGLRDGFVRLSRVWASEADAERALHILLERNGLTEAYRKSSPYARDRDWQEWYLNTTDGEPVADKLNVMYRPGPRPGWVSFQVST